MNRPLDHAALHHSPHRPAPAGDIDAADVTGNPIGFDAPKHSPEHRNFEAACIAAREVRGRAMFSPAHRQSLEAWQNGERAWPWPDPTPAEQAAADDAVRGLAARLSDVELVALSKEQKRFARENRRTGGRAGDCASRTGALVNHAPAGHGPDGLRSPIAGEQP